MNDRNIPADPKTCYRCGKGTFTTVGKQIGGEWFCFNCAWATERKASDTIATSPIPPSSNERTLTSLKRLVRGYVSLLESARERIIFHGGTCDTVEQMEAGDPYLAEARAAILLAESAVETTTTLPGECAKGCWLARCHSLANENQELLRRMLAESSEKTSKAQGE